MELKQPPSPQMGLFYIYFFLSLLSQNRYDNFMCISKWTHVIIKNQMVKIIRYLQLLTDNFFPMSYK